MLYRNRFIDSTQPAPSAELVAQLEDSLGCGLPTDYMQFMAICNGGHAVYEIDVRFDGGSSEPLSFGTLYSLTSSGSWETLPFELEQVRQQEAFPPNKVLPIARDGGGSMLFLDLRVDYRVVAFVHGLPAWTGRRQRDSLVPVAKSFNEYLDALFISDDMIVDAILHFDPKYNVPEMMAELFDTGSPNWRTTHADIWSQHVLHHNGG
jgi:hypothetical protein